MMFLTMLILTWIVVFLMVKAGERKPRCRYKGMTPEEFEYHCKAQFETSKRNLERWAKMKAVADAETARALAAQE